ncbi:hypothetical protein BDFB_007521 [Asbolus verrucosus]|nr:hypothetical protein BDFB_007521 [Asbolus verrucosus]
MPPITG